MSCVSSREEKLYPDVMGRQRCKIPIGWLRFQTMINGISVYHPPLVKCPQFHIFPFNSISLFVDVCQTRGRASHPISEHRQVGWKTEAQLFFFTNFEVLEVSRKRILNDIFLFISFSLELKKGNVSPWIGDSVYHVLPFWNWTWKRLFFF